MSDGSGVVKGAFSYIDPRQEIRTVEYVADRNGFHPTLDHQLEAPQETEAVKQATIRHFNAYNRIAERNALVRIILRYLLFSLINEMNIEINFRLWINKSFHIEYFFQGEVVVPADSHAVAKAKERHHTLFEQIAADHQRIGAELEAQRALFESTSEKEFETYNWNQ